MNIHWADLTAALGLLMVIEGLLPFASPGSLKRAMAAFATASDSTLRIAGCVSMAAGLALIWLVRS
jgi:uncharacterized protein YjeT (DUF2065 family)